MSSDDWPCLDYTATMNHSQTTAAMQSGQVVTDLPCQSCGYNLRGLQLEQACPECGLSVVNSRLGNVTLMGDRKWSGRVARGITLVLAIMPAMVLLPIAGIILAPAVSVGLAGMLLTSWVFVLTLSIAAWLVASPCPTPGRVPTTQLMKRFFLILMAFFGVLACIGSVVTFTIDEPEAIGAAVAFLLFHATLTWALIYDYVTTLIVNRSRTVYDILARTAFSILTIITLIALGFLGAGAVMSQPFMVMVYLGLVLAAMMGLIGVSMMDRLRAQRFALINLGRRSERYAALGGKEASAMLQHLETAAAAAQ